MLIYDTGATDFDDDLRAFDYAEGFTWSDLEAVRQDQPGHSRFLGALGGVGVWYCYGADYYFFEDLQTT